MKMKWYEWVLITLLYGSTVVGMVIVFSMMQEAVASEKKDLPLSSGYIRVEPPVSPIKPSVISRGYMSTLEGGYDADVRLRTYTRGNKHITTGTIGNRQIRIETPKKD
jgi:hypothetical protein